MHIAICLLVRQMNTLPVLARQSVELNPGQKYGRTLWSEKSRTRRHWNGRLRGCRVPVCQGCLVSRSL